MTAVRTSGFVPKSTTDLGVAIWLLGLWALTLSMVAIGGITRLTGSGLSMVEWQPLIGAVPPLSEHAWQATFAKYQHSPQFQQVNHWMELADFKRIFLWEYVHRLLGRAIGLCFLVPYLYFLARRRLRGTAAWRVGAAFALGGAQGLLGWYMVKSGLVSRPEVSHLRLAAHLSLAFFVGQYLLWLALDFSTAQDPDRTSEPPLPWFLWPMLWILIGTQVVFGAFMAGLRAGVLSSTFPDINGHYMPGPFFRFDSLIANLMNNPLAVHWTHRALGVAVLAAVLGMTLPLLRTTTPNVVRKWATALLITGLTQFVLGAATVMLGVPIWLAVCHQVGAYLLLSFAVALGHQTRNPAYSTPSRWMHQ